MKQKHLAKYTLNTYTHTLPTHHKRYKRFASFYIRSDDFIIIDIFTAFGSSESLANAKRSAQNKCVCDEPFIVVNARNVHHIKTTMRVLRSNTIKIALIKPNALAQCMYVLCVYMSESAWISKRNCPLFISLYRRIVFYLISTNDEQLTRLFRCCCIEIGFCSCCRCSRETDENAKNNNGNEYRESAHFMGFSS